MSPKMIVLSALLVLGIQVSYVNSHLKGYVGCFWDNLKVRALQHHGGYFKSVAECRAQCRAANWRYTAMQAQITCYCGTTYDYYGPADGCDTKCTVGGGSCGKILMNSVYLTYPEKVRHQPKGYWGCFLDKKVHALKYWAGHVSSIPECVGLCRMVYYQPFAGLQNSRDCWCGKNYNKYGKSSNCKMKCPVGLECGGTDSNTVYRVHGVPLDPKPPKGYMGCFRDDARRALPIRVFDVKSVRQCIQACYDRNQPYAGLQMGKGCYCGKNYARWGKQTNCNKKCKSGEICGGWSSNSVYKTYAALNPNPPGGHLGCYRDDAKRSLPIMVGHVDSIGECIERCRERKQPYAGLQMGKGCYCGKNYAKYGKQTNCKDRCKTGEICGGFSSNSVYKVCYLGCYHDKHDKRDLPFVAGVIWNVATCQVLCRNKGYKYAGVQSKLLCFCGTKYNQYGKVPNCKPVQCVFGDKYCGGDLINSVYLSNPDQEESHQPSSDYVGCYRDMRIRSLTVKVNNVGSTQECVKQCYDKKQPYAGLQNGRECYCGIRYSKYGKTYGCSKKCRNGEICGGLLRNSVYKIHFDK